MTAPVVTMWNSDDSIEFDDNNKIAFGSLDPGVLSDPIVVDIFNNKGEIAGISTMESARIGTVTFNGFVSGDGVVNGQEVVENQMIQCKSLTLNEQSATAIGGAVTKSLGNLYGKVLVPPVNVVGLPQSVNGGHMALDTYFYVVSAVDETGETLQSVESDGYTLTGEENSVALSWNAVSGAVSYKVYRTTESGVYGAVSFVGDASSNEFVDLLSSLSNGSPLVTATVSAAHKHTVELSALVSTDATPGSVTFRIRVLYRYVT